MLSVGLPVIMLTHYAYFGTSFKTERMNLLIAVFYVVRSRYWHTGKGTQVEGCGAHRTSPLFIATLMYSCTQPPSELYRSHKGVTRALLRRKGPLYRWGQWYVVRRHDFPKDLRDCLLTPDSGLSTLLFYFFVKSFLPSDLLVNCSLHPSLTVLVFLCLIWVPCIYSLVHSVKLPV